ncbi:MAG: endonuclease/exonuclease/phosphatase family protein, partial [Pirellulales bacterium]
METKRRPSGRTLLAGLLVAGGLFYYLGDQRRAVPAATGTSLCGTVTSSAVSRSTLRVATFNIHGGTGRDLRRDLNRTADALRDFDLVWLNEVHGPYFWQVAGQVEELARLTSRRWLFAPTEERWWHHRFGNALLSAQDTAWWQRLPLPSPSRGYRNLVFMELKQSG